MGRSTVFWPGVALTMLVVLGALSLSRPNDNESTERPDVVASSALKDLSAAPARGRQAGGR